MESVFIQRPDLTSSQHSHNRMKSMHEKAREKFKAEVREISAGPEKSSFNLSNPSELIEKDVVFASELVNCWLAGIRRTSNATSSSRPLKHKKATR
jgi:hypothetical protein